jgi:hypothetical protein
MEAVVAHEPDNAEHHDRLAWMYRRAGAWAKAAEAFEQVASLARDERARAALRAAGKLYRDHGRLDRAAAIYRTIVERRASDGDAWRALDDVLTELGRWREVAEVRGERAARAASGVEKAALLRSQARALEQAGDMPAAAGVVAEASHHAPDNVSGLVDYADVLAQQPGREAAGSWRPLSDAMRVGHTARTSRRYGCGLPGSSTVVRRSRAATTDARAVARRCPAHMPASSASPLCRTRSIRACTPRRCCVMRRRCRAPTPAGRHRRCSPVPRRAITAPPCARSGRGASWSEDDEVRDELEDARAAVVVERATASPLRCGWKPSAGCGGARNPVDPMSRRTRVRRAAREEHAGSTKAAEHLRETPGPRRRYAGDRARTAGASLRARDGLAR